MSSYLDPHRNPGSDDAQERARHVGAAPDPYAHPGYPPGGPPRHGPRDPGQLPPGGQRTGWDPHSHGSDNGASRYAPGKGAHRAAGAAAEPDTAARPFVAAEAPPSGPRPRHGRRRASRHRPANATPRTGRAGRNLPAAIAVGICLAAVIVTSLFFPPAFLGVLAAAVSVGIWEMTRAVRSAGAHPPLVPLLAGGLLMVGLAWWAGPDALSLGLLVTVLATMVWRLADGPAGYQRDITAAALIAVYVPFLAGFAGLLAVAPDGHWRVLITLAAVVLSDTGGYAAGVFLGQHRMAPSVSPKKSWEGFGGSVLAAAVGSALLLYFLLDVEPWWGAVFGLAVSVAATLGDLGESMIKRDLGLKDMSRLLPGHGGLMDRLDSILFAVPTAYLLLAIFAGVG